MEEIGLGRNFDRKLKKAFRQLDRQHEGEFVPVVVSLMKMCEIAGKPKHYSWIVNLITKKCEENESYYDYLRLDSDFMVWFDKDGLFLFSEILADFFGLDNIRDLWEYMNVEDKYRHDLYDIVQCIHAMTDEALEEAKNIYISQADEIDRYIFNHIIAEQERRKHPVAEKINQLLKRKG